MATYLRLKRATYIKFNIGIPILVVIKTNLDLKVNLIGL
jgi:ribosomal protein L39E